MDETYQEVDLNLEFESSSFSYDEVGLELNGEDEEIITSNLEEDRGVRAWMHELIEQRKESKVMVMI